MMLQLDLGKISAKPRDTWLTIWLCQVAEEVVVPLVVAVVQVDC
jgi:hypothetical protein